MLQILMAIRFAAEPAKPVVRKSRIPAEAGIPISKKPSRQGIGGRPKADDPSVVLTLRVPKSIADGLPSDWRKQASEFLRGLAS